MRNGSLRYMQNSINDWLMKSCTTLQSFQPQGLHGPLQDEVHRNIIIIIISRNGSKVPKGSTVPTPLYYSACGSVSDVA